MVVTGKIYRIPFFIHFRGKTVAKKFPSSKQDSSFFGLLLHLRVVAYLTNLKHQHDFSLLLYRLRREGSLDRQRTRPNPLLPVTSVNGGLRPLQCLFMFDFFPEVSLAF